MRRILPAAGIAAALHGLLFLTGDFLPESEELLHSRIARAVTIQLLEPVHRAGKPGLAFDSPAPRPVAMRTSSGRVSPVPPRAMSAGPAPAKKPVIRDDRTGSARSMPDDLPGSTQEGPKEPLMRKPESSRPLVEAVPLYRENPPPLYPELARRRGYEGVVLLEVLVTEEGSVGELRVARSSGHDVLDRAAEQTVREWRFDPGRKGNLPVAMRVGIPVRFRLQ